MVWSNLLDGLTGSPEGKKVGSSKSVTTPIPPDTAEVDYEKSCTPLYAAIEQATQDDQWEPIIRFLDTGCWPKTGFFTEEPVPDDLTPANQAKMWVTRFDPTDRTKVLWSQLPLHLAIVCGAPFSVVGRLIELYPAAVRCTDDQHMLPLHLALRHNSSDDVIAYLLMQFPESVNAKGKEGRLPIQCALRAPSKVRGKILEIFIKKTKIKNKLSLAGGPINEKELDLLKSQLEAKTLALQNAESKMEALKKFKDEMEAELANKEEEIENLKVKYTEMSAEAVAEVEDKKMMAEMELKKKIEALEKAMEKQKEEADEALRKARESETSLRQELDTVTKAVNNSNPNELTMLKQVVKKLNTHLVEKSKKETQEQINLLRSELEKSMQQADKKTDQELKTMHQTVAELRNTAQSTNTNQELTSLREEIEHLRAELKSREELSKTKAELEEMKKSMEQELKNTTGKTKEELDALKNLVSSVQGAVLESKNNDELGSLKKELETLRKEMQENALAKKTEKDIEELKQSITKDLKQAKGETYKHLAVTKKTLETIQEELGKSRNSDELLALRKEVKNLKQELKKSEESTKLREEMLELKKTLETEIKNSDGKTRAELQSLKKAIKSIDEKTLQAWDHDELSVRKGELVTVKEHLDRKEKVARTVKEIEELKRSLEANMKAWEGKNRDDISVMLKAADAMNVSSLEKKSYAELKKVAASLRTLREDAKIAEEATKTKQELDALKATLEEALQSSEGKTAHELSAMKRAVDSINVEQLEIRNKEEWELIRTELNALKEDLKTKEAGEGLLKKEIAELRAQIPSCDDSTSTEKRKEKKWKKVFTRFRRGKDDDNSHSTAGSPAVKSVVSAKSAVSAKSVVSAKSAPKPAVSEPKPVQQTTTTTTTVHDDSDDEADNADDDSCDVETISPPSVLPAAKAKRPTPVHVESVSESDDEADDHSVKMNMKSKLYPQDAEKSIKSTKSARTSNSKSAHTSNSKSKSATAPRSSPTATKSVKSGASKNSSKETPKTKNITHEIDVDPETGEITMKPGRTLDSVYEEFEEEKKTEDSGNHLDRTFSL